jgi:hypothetical protein
MEEHVDFKIPPDLRPIYAEEVFVESPLKMVVEKSEKGNEKVRKHGMIVLNFLDNRTKIVVAKIVINPLTARSLGNILLSNSNKMLEELDRKEISKDLKKQMEEKKEGISGATASTQSYIG